MGKEFSVTVQLLAFKNKVKFLIYDRENIIFCSSQTKVHDSFTSITVIRSYTIK